MIGYLAGPIDYHPGEGNWKMQLKNFCQKHDNILLYDPDTFSFGKITRDVSKYIHDVNMHAINEADVVIARWMKGQISVGTPMELYYAMLQRKAIILITDMMDTSVYINFIGHNSRVVVSNIEEAYGQMLSYERDRLDTISGNNESTKIAEGMACIAESLIEKAR